MENAARNAAQAVRFIVEAENQHPNRQDICKQGTQGAPFGEFLVGKRPKSLVQETPTQSNPFGSSSVPSAFGGAPQTTSAFGQPSALGQKPNPFGTPAFGQPSQPAATSPFGQASQAGGGFGQPSQPSASPFGQPSQAAAQNTPAFGQSSQPTSAFGQPSALGVKPNPFGAPAFGQPSQPAAQGSAFGQPSQLGPKPNPFAASANTGSTSSPFATVSNGNNVPAANPFGAPSTNQQNSQSPFGANANQTNGTTSAFGQPSQPAANPFGQPATPATTSAFGAPTPAPAAASNPFAQTNGAGSFASQPNQAQHDGAFGKAPVNANPFGQPSNGLAQAANPFGTPPVQQPAAAASASSGNPYPPGSSRQHPPIESYSSKGMDGRLVMFKGKPVTYQEEVPGIREFDGTWKRIWFPNGPPPYYKDTELPPDLYDDKSKSQWAAFAQTGNFQDGLMPELPPPRECTQWDF